MKFRTSVPVLNHKGLVDYQTKITLVGSCFVNNVGQRLNDHQFNTVINPFGIVFNPFSINNQLNGTHYQEHFIEASERTVSLDFHSKYHGDSVDHFEKKIKSDVISFQQRLSETNILILTFGTAWVYEYIATQQIIANCQKLPSLKFEKKILALDSLTKMYQQTFTDLISINPGLRIVLTVSPVRHLKDGLVQNNRSKAVLLSLCQFLESNFSKHVVYYPSYELVIDDLRDYRFYEKDLLHPNEMAIDYIYDHFKESFMSNACLKTVELVEKYYQFKRHQPLQPSSSEIQKRIEKLTELEEKIKSAKLA